MNFLSRTVTVSVIGLCTLAATAQVSSTSTVTGPNGQTATRSTVRGGGNVQSTITGPNGQTGTRSVSRTAGVDERNLDWSQWADRNPQHHVWRREFANNLNGPQWRRRHSQRHRPGNRHRYRNHDWTAGCDRHEGSHALNEDRRQVVAADRGLARINSEARPAFRLEEETALHHDYTAGDRRLLG